MLKDLYGRSDDEHGYAQYAVVLHATPEQAEKITEFREAIGMRDFFNRPHTTVCGFLYDPPDMDELKSTIRRVANHHRPFRIVFESDPFRSGVTDGVRFGVWKVVRTPQLLAFSDVMAEALEGVIKSARPDRPYNPHLTIYFFASAEEAEKGNELGLELNLGDGYDVASVELAGRSGNARGGKYEIVDSFLLGGLVRREGQPANE